MDPSLVVFRKIKVGGQKEVPDASWLAERSEGLFIVIVKGKSGSKHCICISADTGLILDPVEPYPMRLLSEAIMACVGKEDRFSEILDVREFIKLRELDSKSRNRRGAAQYTVLGDKIAGTESKKNKKRKRGSGAGSSSRN